MCPRLASATTLSSVSPGADLALLSLTPPLANTGITTGTRCFPQGRSSVGLYEWPRGSSHRDLSVYPASSGALFLVCKGDLAVSSTGMRLEDVVQNPGNSHEKKHTT